MPSVRRVAYLIAFIAVAIASVLTLVTCSSPRKSRGGEFAVADPKLAQWLDLSRSEQGGQAGYGSLPIEIVLTPSLYWTHGALEIMREFSHPVDEPEAIAAWVMTLQSASGLFDDPATDAPDLLETYWAIRSLRLLGADIESVPGIAASLLALLPSEEAIGEALDSRTVDQLSWVMILAKCLREIAQEAVGAHYPEASVLKDLADRVLRDHGEALREAAPWEAGYAFEALWLGCRIMSLTDPRGLTQSAVTFLEAQASNLDDAPAGFHGVAMIADLLEMIDSIPNTPIHPRVVLEAAGTFLQSRVFPSLGAIGGFGFTNSSGGNYPDPQMNAVLIRLSNAAGIDYPHTARLVSEMNRSRLANGWGPRMLCPRRPDTTYEAVLTMTHAGIPVPAPERVAAYLRATLLGEPSLRDSLGAALGLILLGEDPDAVRDEAFRRLMEKSPAELSAESEWLADFLFHLDIAPDTPALTKAIDTRVRELVEHIETAPAPRMLVLHELALLSCALDQELLPRAKLAAAILDLEAAGGGFRAISLSPIGDIVSTREAVEALAALGSVDRISAGSCLQFVEACRLSPGYALAVPAELRALGDADAVQADLFTTANAVRILQSLGRSGSWFWFDADVSLENHSGEGTAAYSMPSEVIVRGCAGVFRLSVRRPAMPGLGGSFACPAAPSAPIGTPAGS